MKEGFALLGESELAVRLAFKKLDRNGNGKIDFSEASDLMKTVFEMVSQKSGK